MAERPSQGDPLDVHPVRLLRAADKILVACDPAHEGCAKMFHKATDDFTGHELAEAAAFLRRCGFARELSKMFKGGLAP